MLQNQVYLTQALGKAGMISRQNPIPQMEPVFVEGSDVVAGRFAFFGSKSNQIVGTSSSETMPAGITIFERLQLNTNGGNSMVLNYGETASILLKGCAFIENDGETPNYRDNVFVDPTTGIIKCSSATEMNATSGELNFYGASETYTDYTSITTGELVIDIDGVEQTLSNLDFSSATDMEDVAGVINTALSSNGTCTYTAGLGLTITSSTTGANSTVVFISASSDLESILGSYENTDGTDTMVNTGWTVRSVNEQYQTIEVQKI